MRYVVQSLPSSTNSSTLPSTRVLQVLTPKYLWPNPTPVEIGTSHKGSGCLPLLLQPAVVLRPPQFIELQFRLALLDGCRLEHRMQCINSAGPPMQVTPQCPHCEQWAQDMSLSWTSAAPAAGKGGSGTWQGWPRQWAWQQASAARAVCSDGLQLLLVVNHRCRWQPWCCGQQPVRLAAPSPTAICPRSKQHLLLQCAWAIACTDKPAAGHYLDHLSFSNRRKLRFHYILFLGFA